MLARAIALVALVAHVSSSASAASTTYRVREHFDDTDWACSTEAPSFSVVIPDGNCGYQPCDSPFGDPTILACVDDYKAYTECMSNRALYLLQERFSSASDCVEASFDEAIGTPETGECVSRPSNHLNRYARVFLEANGSVTIYYYNGTSCADSLLDEVQTIAADVIEDYSCDSSTFLGAYNDYKFSIYQGGESTVCDTIYTTTTGGIDSTKIGGIIGGVVGIVVIITLLFMWRRRKASALQKRQQQESTGYVELPSAEAQRLPRSETGPSDYSGSLPNASKAGTNLWEDDAITTSRINRDEIQLGSLLSQGAYGQVFAGMYDRERVAVKMLRPEMRKNLSHVNDFLAEVKLSASMYHPHIVRFIGVAWKMLSDLCVVMEFMEGGDLRSLLDSYLSSGAACGFNRDKAVLAFHVCQALTYMHSLETPVIHRDLKSRNVLLTSDWQAKLTDFGVSRQRLDATMTSGVGTMLWMAPEVMVGGRYDEKADMFSFGVVLSELDVHTLPYAAAKAAARKLGAREWGDAVVIQKVSTGELRVDFSDASPSALVALGNDCAALDPAQRPTAAEALYRLQVAISEL